jgi:hypothetical protein
MSKFIGVKMVEAVPMTASEAINKGYRIGNSIFDYYSDGRIYKIGDSYVR